MGEDNYLAYKYSEAVSAEMDDICKPLNNIGITVFGYMKIFRDGRYISLCNNLPWKKFYFEKVKKNFIIWDKAMQIGNSSNELIPILWPSHPNSEIMQYLYDHNIWHGFQYVRFSDDCFELWGSCTDKNNEEAQKFLFRHRAIFLKFIDYFNKQNLVKTTLLNEQSFASYQEVNFPKMEDTTFEERRVNQFLQEIHMDKKQIIRLPGSSIFLSEREYQCFTLLAQGDTFKNIANKLNLSARTVEIYIKNIKLKIGYKDKVNLTKIYQDNSLI